jgi:UDP-N-acetyl-D-galactosamine dehydrogenase
MEAMKDLHALVLAVPHAHFIEIGTEGLCDMIAHQGVFVDIKSTISPISMRRDISYWGL